MRGRKPVPQALNAVRGNPGKRKPREDVPAPPPGLPQCPAHLDAGAKREWKRITPALAAAQLLSTADRTILALYCTAYSRWEDAEKRLRETEGVVVLTANGNPVQNPYLSVANKAMEQLHKYAAELGMSPSSRMRVAKIPNEKQAQNPADRFFRPRVVA